MRTLALALILPLIAGCPEKDEDDTSQPEGDTDTDTDADGDTDADTDADSDADTDVEYMKPGDPVYQATFGAESWSGEPGYWFASGNTSYLVAVAGEQQVNIEVEGDVNVRGTYGVGEVLFTDTIASDNFDFYYQGDGDDDATFTVLGNSKDGEYVWGEFAGSIALVDSMGLEADTTLDALVVESWPKF